MAFACTSISEGDEFEIACHFTTNFRRAEFKFTHKEGVWSVFTVLRPKGALPSNAFITALTLKGTSNDGTKSTIEEPLKQLGSLIGLHTVKEEVKTDYPQSSVDSNQLDFLCFRLIIATFAALKTIQ